MNTIIFDKPQWQIKRAYKIQKYAGIDNKVYVHNIKSGGYYVYIDIPIELFKYLKDVCRLRILDLNNPRLGLYLREDNSSCFYLAYSKINGVKRNYIKLWCYPKNKFPVWSDRKYQIA